MNGEFTLALEAADPRERTARYSVQPPPAVPTDMPRSVTFHFSERVTFETPPWRLQVVITEA